MRFKGTIARSVAHPLRAISAAHYRAWTAWHGLDLGEETNETIGVPDDIGTYHANSGGPDLRAAIRFFEIPTASVFDVGCGKGGALIEFYQIGFRHIGGIEVSDRLFQTCRSNLAALGVKALIVKGDAANFSGFSPFELIYFYNSLSDLTLDRTLANICTYHGKRILFRNWLRMDVISRHRLARRGEFVRNDQYTLFDVVEH